MFILYNIWNRVSYLFKIYNFNHSNLIYRRLKKDNQHKRLDWGLTQSNHAEQIKLCLTRKKNSILSYKEKIFNLLGAEIYFFHSLAKCCSLLLLVLFFYDHFTKKAHSWRDIASCSIQKAEGLQKCITSN